MVRLEELRVEVLADCREDLEEPILEAMGLVTGELEQREAELTDWRDDGAHE